MSPVSEDGRKLDKSEVERLSLEVSNYHKELKIQNEELIRANSELNKMEQRYRELYDHAPIPFFSFDYSGEIISANDAYCYFTGISKDAVLERSIFDFLEIDSVGLFEFFLDSLSKNSAHYQKYRQSLEINFFIRGKKIETLLYLSFFEQNGKKLVRAAVADITERNEARRELENEQQRYQIALQNSPEYIFEYDINLDVFTTYGNMFDADVPKNIAVKHFNFLSQVNDGQFCNPRDSFKIEALIHGTSGNFEIQLTVPDSAKDSKDNKEPKYEWFMFFGTPIYEDKVLCKIIGRISNISVRKQAESELLEKSYHDGLTLLYTPARAIVLIEEALDSEKDNALILFDLKSMHRLNESYSMTFGNHILHNAAQVISNLVPEDAITSRVGGDEFLLFLPNSTLAKAKDLSKKIRTKIGELYIGSADKEQHQLDTEIVIASNINAIGKPDMLALLDIMYQHKKFYSGSIHIIPAGDIELVTPPSQTYENYTSFSGLSTIIANKAPDVMSFAFDLLEKTRHTPSAINLLLSCLGKKYSLKYIHIFEISTDFLTRTQIYSWSDALEVSQSSRVFHYPSAKVLNEIKSSFDSFGVLDLTEANRPTFSPETLDYLSQYFYQNTMVCSMFHAGNITGAIVFATDIDQKSWTNENKKTLADLAKLITTHINRNRSDRLTQSKTEFLSRMSHEIRTPINGITGMLSIMHKLIDDDEDIKNHLNDKEYNERFKDCLDKIDKSTDYLLATINDILEMSKIERGKLDLKNDVFSFSDILENMETMFASTLKEKDLHFSVIRKNTDCSVRGDMLRISQILVNLLSNAIRYTPKDGTIILSITQNAKAETNKSAVTYTISVSDTGVGIDKDNLQTIIEMFASNNILTTRSNSGFGLGLSISSSIVRLMGSELKVKSTLAKGSEFYFTLTLPIAGINDDAVTEISFPLEQKEQKKINRKIFETKRVLLVEDNEINRDIAKSLLEIEGFTVETAVDGQYALDKFTDNPAFYYDVIIMDIRMPRMDGLVATTSIRNTKKQDARTIPIIAMTADVLDEKIEHFIECGMNGYLTKPVDVPHMLELLQSIFQK